MPVPFFHGRSFRPVLWMRPGAKNVPGAIAISGAVQSTSTLTATITDANGFSAATYQWQVSANGLSGWSNISGATAQTYLIPESQIGQYLRVTAAYTDNAGNIETLTSAATVQVVDHVIAAIATSLPYAPVSRRSAIATSARFAISSNPVSVITKLGTASVCVSLRAGDGCLYQDTTRTNEVVSTGTSAASIWNWQANTRFLAQSNPAKRGTVETSGLRLLANRHYTGTPYSGFTTGERLAVTNSITSGVWAVEATTETNAAAASGPLAATPWITGAVIDTFGSDTDAKRPVYTPSPTIDFTARHRILRSAASSTTRKSQIDLLTENTNSSGATAFAPAHSLGYDGVTGTNNHLFQVTWNSELSSGDRLIQQRFLYHYCQLYNVIFDGDSITLGQGVSTANSYPVQAQVLAGKTFSVTNIAVGAQTVANQNSDFSTQVPPLFEANRLNVVVCFGGTNDLYFGANAATVYSRLQTYWAAVRALGGRVIAVTSLPRSNSGTPAGFESDRQSLNTLIRSNTSLYDALADVGNDSTIGQAGQETNTTYYQDLVHPTAAGMAIIAGYVRTAILSVS